LEHLIGLTNSFSWEELPTRDPETGYLTNAGYIRLIPSITKYITALVLAFHGTQTIVRIVLNHDMVFTTWYPFDVSASPAYEIANLTQVKFRILHLLNLIDSKRYSRTNSKEIRTPKLNTFRFY
jgi:hypothetical protein